MLATAEVSGDDFVLDGLEDFGLDGLEDVAAGYVDAPLLGGCNVPDVVLAFDFCPASVPGAATVDLFPAAFLPVAPSTVAFFLFLGGAFVDFSPAVPATFFSVGFLVEETAVFAAPRMGTAESSVAVLITLETAEDFMAAAVLIPLAARFAAVVATAGTSRRH